MSRLAAVLAAVLVAVLAVLPASAIAASGGSPLVVSHSGYLLDANDLPVNDPALALTFRLYDTPIATGQQLQWSAACSVSVSRGYYAVNLGEAPCAGDGLDTADLPLDADRYLEVSLGSATMSPRARVAISPTAALARNADQLAGHPPADFWLRADAVDAATLGGQSLTQLDGRFLKPEANGNVGLGVANPTSKLAVAGTIQSTSGGFLFPDGTTQATAGVTGLSATGPISVTGSAPTPSIGIATADSATTGALSNTDWQTFNAKVNRTGDTMSGDLNLGSNRVTNLLDPSAAQDAATKSWVTSQVSSAAYTLPTASASALGGVKVGTGLSVAGDGTLAVAQSFGYSPVGAIVAWHKNLTNTPALAAGWAECNGQTISDAASPYNGVTLPDLNGQARFLRGGAASGGLQNASQVAVTVETNSAALFFDASGRNMTAYNKDFDSTSMLTSSQRGFINKSGLDDAPNQIYAARVRPVNMTVVWIIRIK